MLLGTVLLLVLSYLFSFFGGSCFSDITSFPIFFLIILFKEHPALSFNFLLVVLDDMQAKVH
jgi:hypothetical protein